MVMDWLKKWEPVYQAAGEDGGVSEVHEDGGAGEPPPSGPGSGRSELRQQLEKNFETDRKVTEKGDTPRQRDRGRQQQPRRVAGGAEIETEAPTGGAEPGAEGTDPGDGTEAQQSQQAAVAAPEGFSAEAKAEWAKTPPTVQTAIIKRETDMAKGVEELKNKYGEMDRALAPHMEAIRQVNQTAPQAISQLFGWFQALSANPKIAFPALLQSFNLRQEDVFGPGQVDAQQAQAGAQQGQPEEVSPAVQRYINDLTSKIDQLGQAFTQKIGGLENSWAQQTQAKTDEILKGWSTGKAHFESVRHLMANLIASGAVPLKEGSVDLDRAYEMAIYADPGVRAQVLKAQQDTERKAAAEKAATEKRNQQEAADKARRAGVSIGGGAPGQPGLPTGKPTGKKSVRESIMEAREQLQE